MQAIPWFVSLWQKTHQMAENSPNGRKLTKWQKTHQMAENPPNGRKLTKWQKTHQMAEEYPHHDQHSAKLYTMIGHFCHFVSFVYDIAKALIQFPLFFGQDYFPTVSFCLSHCYFWVTVLHSFATSNSPYSCCFACAMI